MSNFQLHVIEGKDKGDDKDGIAAYCIGKTNIEPFGEREWLCPSCSSNLKEANK